MKSIKITHKGKRKTNQDFVCSKNIKPNTFVYLVADGMGGYDRGEIAAQISIESVLTFLSTTDFIDKESTQKAINKANLAIRQFQEINNSQLGATLGGVIISNNIAKCFWVGDVKILHYSDGKNCFESKSHNLMNEFLETDSSIESIKGAQYSNIVTRSIHGDLKRSEIDYEELQLKKNDQLVICSDGVHNILDSQTILFMLNSADSIVNGVEKLNKRLKEEASDNASLIAIEV